MPALNAADARRRGLSTIRTQSVVASSFLDQLSTPIGRPAVDDQDLESIQWIGLLGESI